jgi:hypothetical protein
MFPVAGRAYVKRCWPQNARDFRGVDYPYFNADPGHNLSR